MTGNVNNELIAYRNVKEKNALFFFCSFWVVVKDFHFLKKLFLYIGQLTGPTRKTDDLTRIVDININTLFSTCEFDRAISPDFGA